jgi:hypothetical protein
VSAKNVTVIEGYSFIKGILSQLFIVTFLPLCPSQEFTTYKYILILAHVYSLLIYIYKIENFNEIFLSL